eukprot:Gb_26469 [translate_table: standard]
MAPGVQSHGAAAVQEEIAGFVKLYSDGGIVRTDDPAMHIPPSEEDRTRDVVLDDNAGLWVRLYLPPLHTPNHNLPVVLYFHGGGFCCFSPAFLFFHRFSLKWTDAMGAIIVSVTIDWLLYIAFLRLTGTQSQHSNGSVRSQLRSSKAEKRNVTRGESDVQPVAIRCHGYGLI